MFEMGAKFDDGWSLDKGEEKRGKKEIKTYDKHQLFFAKEKRKSKVVTIVKPFYLEKKELQLVLKSLKKKLATGGSLKDDTLEFQGDVKASLINALESMGFGLKGR